MCVCGGFFLSLGVQSSLGSPNQNFHLQLLAEQVIGHSYSTLEDVILIGVEGVR